MREIKFRAWDIAKKQMWSKVTLIDWNPKKIVLQQYTGLKDKNGKEIYEGDIYYNESYSRNEVIESLEDLYFNDRLVYPLYTDDAIVLGNIYEHPELLKGD